VELRRFTLMPEDPMTEERLPLAELLAKAGDGDFLRAVAEAVVQLLIDLAPVGWTRVAAYAAAASCSLRFGVT
jgi:hypothetical protein